MRWWQLALGGSLLAAVLGITLVLLFSRLYVVPHLLTRDQHRTKCKITNITSFDDRSCVYIIVKYEDTNQHTRDGLLHQDTTPQVSSKQCFCTGCDVKHESGSNVTWVEYEERRLREGDMVKCFFLLPQLTRLSISETSNWIVLNAILWPSLVFIGGFVGIFFSCIAMQRDLARRAERTRSVRLADHC